MAEAILHDNIPTHPCARCAGDRQVQFIEWRGAVPWHVICQVCGNTSVGTTLEDAVDAWDGANPARELSAQDIQAVAVAILATALTPPVRATLQKAADLFAQTPHAQTLDLFLNWCDDIASPAGA